MVINAYICNELRAIIPEMQKGLKLLVIVMFLSLANFAAAESRQYGSHVHGTGELNVAVDGKNLIIELASPAMNITGFEHEPKNEEQAHTVHEAIEQLSDGKLLFILTKEAGCNLHDAHVETDLMHESSEHENSHHHDEHKKKSKQEHDHDSAHSEFEATYHFECTSPDKLKAITVQLFELFPGFEELHVQLLTPKGQTAIELTPKKSHISL